MSVGEKLVSPLYTFRCVSPRTTLNGVRDQPSDSNSKQKGAIFFVILKGYDQEEFSLELNPCDRFGMKITACAPSINFFSISRGIFFGSVVKSSI